MRGVAKRGEKIIANRRMVKRIAGMMMTGAGTPTDLMGPSMLP